MTGFRLIVRRPLFKYKSDYSKIIYKTYFESFN